MRILTLCGNLYGIRFCLVNDIWSIAIIQETEGTTNCLRHFYGLTILTFGIDELITSLSKECMNLFSILSNVHDI